MAADKWEKQPSLILEKTTSIFEVETIPVNFDSRFFQELLPKI